MTPTGILETILYCDDLAAAERFYTEVIGLDVFLKEPGRHIFFKVGGSMLLLFDPRHTASIQTHVRGAPIPLHGMHGSGHMAFSAPASQIDDWKRCFGEHGIVIESEVHWPNGARSLYVRDPAGNCIEIASPDLWGLT